MMKNVTKTNNKTALLAILAVFAMVAAGAAVVMTASDVQADPSDPDHTTTAATVPYVKETGIIGATAVVDMTKATADVTLTLTNETNATIYVLEGAWASNYKLTIAAGGTSGNATIYVAKEVSATTGSVTVTFYDNVSAVLAWAAGAKADIAIADSTETAGPIIHAKTNVTAWATYNTTVNYGLMYNDLAAGWYYFAKGAELPRAIVIPDATADVVYIKEATGIVNKLDNEDALQCQLTFDALTTATALVITGQAADVPKITEGNATMTGDLTVVKGTFKTTDAGVAAGVKTVLNAVAIADVTAEAATTIAPSQTAVSDTYTYAYGTADLKYSKEGNALVNTVINLVNSSADISVHMKDTNEGPTQADVELTTAKITTTLTISVNGSHHITDGVIAAITGGEDVALAIDKFSITEVEALTLTGTAAKITYDLAVAKDVVVDLTLATGSEKDVTVAGTLTVANVFVDIDGDLTVASGATFAPVGLASVDGDLTVASGATFAPAALATVGGDLTVAGTLTTTANIAVTGDATVSGTLTCGGNIGIGGDVTVSGTFSIGVDKTATFTTSTVDATITAGTSTFKFALTEGTMTLAGDGTITNWTDAAGAGALNLVTGAYKDAQITVAGALTVGASASIQFTGASIAFGAGEDLLVRGTMTVAGNVTVTDANVSVYGTMSSTEPRTVTMTKTDGTGTIAFKAYSGATLTYINVVKTDNAYKDKITIDIEGATGTVYLSGTISYSAAYAQTQNVVVNGDLDIVSGAKITIAGAFDINEGVTMTITNGVVLVNSDIADVEIKGAIAIEDKGFLNIYKTKAVDIYSTVSNNGSMYVNTASATIKEGGIVTNNDGSNFMTNNFSVAKGGILNLYGFTALTNVTNSGAVNINAAKFTQFEGINADSTTMTVADGATTPTITQKADDATVVIVGFTFRVNADSKLTIKDDAITVKDSTPLSVNKIELTADVAGNRANVGMGGITVTSDVTKLTILDVSCYYRTLVIDGAIKTYDVRTGAGLVDPAGTLKICDATTVVADLDSSIDFADDFVVGKNVKIDVYDNLLIDGDMVLGEGATINSGAATGEITVSGSVIAPIAAITKTEVVGVDPAAAYFSITVGTDTTHYYMSIEEAMEFLALYGEDATVTIYGDATDGKYRLVVADDVIVPSNVRVVAAAGSGFEVGTAFYTDATMTVGEGATLAAGLTINVYGSLDVMNVKKCSATVNSDVAVKNGDTATYTGLARALEDAEAGDIIEASRDVLIEDSLTVPAGVTLYIPDDLKITVDPAAKVTVTVNGILMCSKILLKDGSFGPETDDDEATVVVNGTLMSSYTTVVDDVAQYYNASGAYWYVSDAVGNYVYIGSLADAIASKQVVAVYGKVTETSAVTATKNITLADFDFVDIDTVLTVSDLKLSNSSASVTLDADNAGIINGKVSIPNSVDTAVVNLSKFDGKLAFVYSSLGNTSVLSEFDSGSMTVSAGTLTINKGILLADTDVLNVAAGAQVTVTGDEGSLWFAGVSANIAGTLVAEKSGSIFINSEKLVLTGTVVADYDATVKKAGDVDIGVMTFTSGTLMAEENAKIDILVPLEIGTIPGSVGAAPTIEGVVSLGLGAYVVAYPGADLSGMEFEEGVEAVTTTLVLNGVTIATLVADKVTAPAIMDVIKELPLDKIAGLNEDDVKELQKEANYALWGLPSAVAEVGDVDTASATAAVAEVGVTMSWDTGMSLYVDNVRIVSTAADQNKLSVGVHTVMVKVNPGYKYADGTGPSITFNGKAVTGLMVFEITSDMAQHGAAVPVLSATADIVVDEQPIPEQKEKDDTMMIVLLAILVIMIAILIVVVILRMMRS